MERQHKNSIPHAQTQFAGGWGWGRGHYCHNNCKKITLSGATTITHLFECFAGFYYCKISWPLADGEFP